MNTRFSVLVTGGAGFIGTHLSRKLISAGHRVRVLDLRDPETSVAGVEYVKGDVRNRTILSSALDGVDAVYHLAATVSVPVCQKDPVESYSNNFSATLVLLDAVRARNIGQKTPIRFAFASTAALYGNNGNDGRALKEEDFAEEFLSYYAAQKHASEQAIRLYRSCHGIPAMIFRFFNVFGPGQDPTSPYSGVITVFTKWAKEGKPLPLNGGGTQTRDFIAVRDLTDALVKGLELEERVWDGHPINLGSGSRLTIRELAEIIVKASGKGSQITSAPPREGDVLHSLADISRANKILKFQPHTTLSEGLTELVNEV